MKKARMKRARKNIYTQEDDYNATFLIYGDKNEQLWTDENEVKEEKLSSDSE